MLVVLIARVLVVILLARRVIVRFLLDNSGLDVGSNQFDCRVDARVAFLGQLAASECIVEGHHELVEPGEGGREFLGG